MRIIGYQKGIFPPDAWSRWFWKGTKYVCECGYVCMYVRMYVCTYVRVYVCMYVCMYVTRVIS